MPFKQKIVGQGRIFFWNFRKTRRGVEITIKRNVICQNYTTRAFLARKTQADWRIGFHYRNLSSQFWILLMFLCLFLNFWPDGLSIFTNLQMAFSVAFIIAFFQFYRLVLPKVNKWLWHLSFHNHRAFQQQHIWPHQKFSYFFQSCFSFLLFWEKFLKTSAALHSCRNGHTHIHHAKYRLLISFFRSYI